MHYIYPNGDEVYIVDAMFISKNYKGKIIVEQSECKDVKFFHIDSLPENISPPVKPSLEELIRKYKDGSLFKLLGE